MSEINFLPDRFVVKQRSRRRIVFEFLLVVSVAAGLVYAYQALHKQVSSLEKRAEQLVLTGTVAKAKGDEAGRLRNEFNEYASSLRVQREVGLPIAHSSILASIASLQPDAVGLTQLVLECDRPKPAPPTDPNAKAKPKRSKKKTVEPVRELSIDMVGIAPDDDRITDFFGRLDNHRLFRDVKLEFSKQVNVDNLNAMRFRITCKVALDRIYRSEDARKELADAN